MRPCLVNKLASFMFVFAIIGCKKQKITSAYDFSFSPGSGYGGVDSVTFLPDAGVPANASLEWDFGDGTTSTVPMPTHLYTVAGNFTTSLKVNGTLSAQHSIPLLPPINSGHTAAMGGTRIWQRTEHQEPVYWYYYTDTIALDIIDQETIKFNNRTFYCTGIDKYEHNTLYFNSAVPQEHITYYYQTDSIAYRYYEQFAYPYEHAYFEVIMHTP